MTEEDIRAVFINELVKIAPDLDAQDIGEDERLQDDLGLDSMDILNLVAALHKAFGVSIPEPDYPKIATTRLAVSYLQEMQA
ncbi:acyl carrier protein [Ruegeria profundi]|uniref:Acyl carrier protein AcpXL n=1 Tax=Ruegeria profundi TaxID=1685378 RepID=A0A0X3TV56_9RHOB|nr:phosphopantetheine-binding protein [Ruegeria profundi]KUJ77180.1 phosphopantetheine-binding protein [Ruegeria profundi]